MFTGTVIKNDVYITFVLLHVFNFYSSKYDGEI